MDAPQMTKREKYSTSDSKPLNLARTRTAGSVTYGEKHDRMENRNTFFPSPSFLCVATRPVYIRVRMLVWGEEERLAVEKEEEKQVKNLECVLFCANRSP